MAKVLILGGGFGAVAAKRLAHQLGDEHQISLVAQPRLCFLSRAGEAGVERMQSL